MQGMVDPTWMIKNTFHISINFMAFLQVHKGHYGLLIQGKWNPVPATFSKVQWNSHRTVIFLGVSIPYQQFLKQSTILWVNFISFYGCTWTPNPLGIGWGGGDRRKGRPIEQNRTSPRFLAVRPGFLYCWLFILNCIISSQTKHPWN